MAALVAGVAVALLGLAVPPLRLLFDYSWFVGLEVSAGAYVVLMQRSRRALESEWEGEAWRQRL